MKLTGLAAAGSRQHSSHPGCVHPLEHAQSCRHPPRTGTLVPHCPLHRTHAQDHSTHKAFQEQPLDTVCFPGVLGDARLQPCLKQDKSVDESMDTGAGKHSTRCSDCQCHARTALCKQISGDLLPLQCKTAWLRAAPVLQTWPLIVERTRACGDKVVITPAHAVHSATVLTLDRAHKPVERLSIAVIALPHPE